MQEHNQSTVLTLSAVKHNTFRQPSIFFILPIHRNLRSKASCINTALSNERLNSKTPKITNYALTFASFTILLDCVSMKHKKLDDWRRVAKFLIHTHVSQPSQRDIGQKRRISLRYARNSPALRVRVDPPTRPFQPITR